MIKRTLSDSSSIIKCLDFHHINTISRYVEFLAKITIRILKHQKENKENELTEEKNRISYNLQVHRKKW